MADEKKNLEEEIRKVASGPKSAEVDGQKAEQHPLTDLVAADEYLEKKKALKKPPFGLRFAKFNHSGPC